MINKIKDTLGISQLTTFYQAIISVKTHEIIAYEALVRAWNTSNELMSPDTLFINAHKKQCIRELDHICQVHAIKMFAKEQTAKRKILSLNLPNYLFSDNKNQHSILELVHNLQFDKDLLMLEICEDDVTDEAKLLEFVQLCHEKKILVAIDDLGKKFSNLDRLVMLLPDVVKLDRCLIKNIHKNRMQQAVVKSMVELCNSMGSLLLAEGTETKEEVLCLLDLGINYFQGFYFSHPAPESEFHFNENRILSIIENTGNEFVANCKINLQHKRLFWEMVSQKAKFICNQLSKSQEALHKTELRKALLFFENADCAYILDQKGIQVSATVFQEEKKSYSTNKFFAPAIPGTDHSQKDYFIYLKPWTEEMAKKIELRPDFISHRYRSMATGTTCQTFCCWFTDITQKPFILCLDFTS